MRQAVCDVDDLWCEEQIQRYLVPLKEQLPSFQITCYAIPNLLGPVHDLKAKYPWVIFAQHGFEHSFAECLSWTSELAKANLELGASMGYAPLFKPPQWLCDLETELACKELGVVLHHHKEYKLYSRGLKVYPGPGRLRVGRFAESIHSHIQRNPATDFLTETSQFKPEYLKQFESFLTPLDEAITLP